MKDPYTRAFEAKWLGLEIWHRDRNGVDGACGWTYPKLTDKQRRQLKDFAWCEAHEPYFLRSPGKQFNGPRYEAETLYRALVLQVARTICVRVSLEYAQLKAISKVHNDEGRGADVFCWQPGYHSNFSKDSVDSREDHFRQIVSSVACDILADLRPWYKHPRWHVHHWRIRWRPIMWLNLRFIMRCKYCNKRFKRGTYPTSNWDSSQHWHAECASVAAAEVIKHG